mmetsp:Transcript_22952/g.32955  ORF Transcript_22952/g.32955 Transcript_22952/m.32955 type:complete len:83 (-) Transcript_22952:507-755(-)
MKSVVVHMSGNSECTRPQICHPCTLPSPLVGCTGGRDCSICPELSKFFPPPPRQEMDLEGAASMPEVKESCDFFLGDGQSKL